MNNNFSTVTKYDEDNIFAKIIRKEIPSEIIYENDNVLCFKDINPRTPHHILIIPKGQYKDMTDFSLNASDKEILSLIKTIGRLAGKLGIEENGYRLISNTGVDGRQEVPHLHIHLMGGRDVGRMTSI